MFPLTTLAALERLLEGVSLVLERLDKMDEQIKAELAAIKDSQAATVAALDNLSGDISAQSDKIDELTAALAAEAISPETKGLLDEVKAGQDALQAKAEALAAINP